MFEYRPKRDNLETLALLRSYSDEHPAHGQDRMAKVFHRSHGWNHYIDRAFVCQAQIGESAEETLTTSGAAQRAAFAALSSQ